jgi:outer membrane receptor protein involved in Fe transport
LPLPQTGATYSNIGGAVFRGLELETKAKLFDKLYWTGAYTFQTNRDQLGKNNMTSSPNHIAKIGLSYDVTPQLQLSVFDTFFSNAKKFPGAAQVNPTADSYHNVTVNGNYRLDDLLGSHFAKHVTLTLYVDNLLNEKIYYPEFNRKRINTTPASGGRSIFGEIAIEF